MMTAIFCALVIMIGVGILAGLAAILERCNMLVDLLEIVLDLREGELDE